MAYDQTPPSRLYGIIGKPLGHSMSPLIHNWAFAQSGFPGVYMPWELDGDELGRFVDAVRLLPIHGASVTIPHKTAIMEHIDGLGERARRVGAVNTLYRDGERVMGDNTDIAGFMKPLVNRSIHPERALVLGAGGAAKAVLAGLEEMGVPEIVLTNRTLSTAEALSSEFACTCLDWEDKGSCRPDLVVNTTPLGMSGEHQELSPWSVQDFLEGCVVYDLVYNPRRTRFLTEAALARCVPISGLEMFVHQAAAQFEIWTGSTFSISDAMQLAESRLA